MKIKEFVENYNNIATMSLKDKYIKDNLELKTYLPVLTKDAIATILVEKTIYEYEKYIDENGEVKQRQTNKIEVNSNAQYILFCRLVIENYTNLEIETSTFFEEYDLLKQSGLLNKLMSHTDEEPSLIPIEELIELHKMIENKQKDILFNHSTPQAYISEQIERFSTLIGVTLNPILEKIASSINNMDEKDVEKISSKIDKLIKKMK